MGEARSPQCSGVLEVPNWARNPPEEIAQRPVHGYRGARPIPESIDRSRLLRFQHGRPGSRWRRTLPTLEEAEPSAWALRLTRRASALASAFLVETPTPEGPLKNERGN